MIFPMYSRQICPSLRAWEDKEFPVAEMYKFLLCLCKLISSSHFVGLHVGVIVQGYGKDSLVCLFPSSPSICTWGRRGQDGRLSLTPWAHASAVAFRNGQIVSQWKHETGEQNWSASDILVHLGTCDSHASHCKVSEDYITLLGGISFNVFQGESLLDNEMLYHGAHDYNKKSKKKAMNRCILDC